MAKGKEDRWTLVVVLSLGKVQSMPSSEKKISRQKEETLQMSQGGKDLATFKKKHG